MQKAYKNRRRTSHPNARIFVKEKRTRKSPFLKFGYHIKRTGVVGIVAFAVPKIDKLGFGFDTICAEMFEKFLGFSFGVYNSDSRFVLFVVAKAFERINLALVETGALDKAVIFDVETVENILFGKNNPFGAEGFVKFAVGNKR